MSLKARIQEDVKAAMRAQDKRRLGALRLVSAAIKQREVDERIELDDSQVVAVLRKMLKQRQDSLTQFRAGGRDDLADQEAFEIALIEGFREALRSRGQLELDEEIYGDAAALSGVSKFSARVKCAMLAWVALEDAIAKA